MNRWLRTLGMVAVFLLLATPLAAAAPQDAPQAYLVGLRENVTARVLVRAGFHVQQEWAQLGAVQVVANAAELARLHVSPNVAYVEPDRPVHAFAAGFYADNGEITWGLQAVRAQEAWALGSAGKGIKVCIIDTGIDYNHPEFRRADGTSVIKGSKNFVLDGHPTAKDGNGHGTHVAGTIAAQKNGTGVAGVAPDVTLYIARVRSDTGSGSTSGVINGLNWCVSVGANIANLSLGSSSSSRTEQNAFDSAYKKGLLPIAASGNDGKSTISYPANYASVVAVGAVDPNLTLASFSNYGTNQELVAPGVNVLSSVPLGTGLKGSASENGTAYPSTPLEYAGKGSISGPLVECGLADSTTACKNVPASGNWIALINRGTISFADKVKNVTAQGADAAIIANNDAAHPADPGNFTLGSAGTWIPAVSVSYNSGTAIRSGGLGSGAVAISTWDYAYFSGTSMASPHATGVAALAWSAKTGLTAAKIRTVLQKSAKDLGAAGKDTTFGYGLVQGDAAVKLAKNTT